MIYSKLLEELDGDWSIDEKVFYLDYRIGQESIFDVRVQYLAEDVELHKTIYNARKNIDKDEDNRIVCNTGSLLLKDLLSRRNIYSELVYKDKEKSQFPDVALIYRDEEGRYKFVNVIGDLYICKLNLPTQFFGLGEDLLSRYSIDKPICKLEDEELKRIEEDLGIDIQYKFETFMNLLRDEIKNKSSFKSNLKQININNGTNTAINSMSDFKVLEEKMDFISRYFPCRMKNAGPNEIKQFYMWLLWGYVFNRAENKAIKMKEYYKRIEDEVKVINVIEIIDGESRKKQYIYLPEERTYKKIDGPQEFSRIVQGYYLYGKEKQEHEML